MLVNCTLEGQSTEYRAKFPVYFTYLNVWMFIANRQHLPLNCWRLQDSLHQPLCSLFRFDRVLNPRKMGLFFFFIMLILEIRLLVEVYKVQPRPKPPHLHQSKSFVCTQSSNYRCGCQKAATVSLLTYQYVMQTVMLATPSVPLIVRRPKITCALLSQSLQGLCFQIKGIVFGIQPNFKTHLSQLCLSSERYTDVGFSSQKCFLLGCPMQL